VTLGSPESDAVAAPDELCPCGKPARIGGYCSWTHRSQYNKKAKKPRKPPSTGSKARKARIKQMVKNYSKEDWQKALDYFGGCAYCNEKRDDLQQDHFIPVNDGGQYTPDNIVPACPSCNSRKQKIDPFEWLVVRERRLREYLKIEEYFASLKGNYEG
jgi:5-methylcytosine-specific restriction endonuclease McrA